VSASPQDKYYTGIAPIVSYPYGKSYGEWAAEWQKWVVTIPKHDPKGDISPYNPLYGGPCSVGQNGNVWFLTGVLMGTNEHVERICTVPKDTALYFPLVNEGYVAFLNDLPLETRTLAFVRSQSKSCPGPVTITAAIDGLPVMNPESYYEESPFYEVQIPVDNIFGFQKKNPKPGPKGHPFVYDLYFSPAADAGYYLFLYPLNPGDHTIEWKAQWKCGADKAGNGIFNNQDMIYHITVTP
jgi:hypothetical protein